MTLIATKAPSTYRAPLPPLQSIDNTCRPNLTPLLLKALSTTSLKEKNDIIKEIQFLFNNNIRDIKQIGIDNIQKEKLLESMKKKVQEKENEYLRLLEQTSFYNNLQSLRDKKSKDYLIEEIKMWEKERNTLQPISNPSLLNKVLTTNYTEKQRYFKLFDLLFKRIEETVYSFHRRFHQYEEAIENELEVTSVFSNMKGLLDTYNELMMKRQVEIVEEKSFIFDAFLRRRKFNEISLNVSRSLSDILSNAIKSCQDTLDYFDKFNFQADNYEKSELSFDDVCKDTCMTEHGFNYDITDFGNSADPDVIKQMQRADTNEQKLECLKLFIEKSNQLNEEISSKILEYRRNPSVFFDGTHNRLERLSEENFRYFKTIEEMQDNIENLNKTILGKIVDIKRSYNDLNQYRRRYVGNLVKFDQLRRVHMNLMPKIYQNEIISRSLFSIILLMGMDLFHKNANNNELSCVWNYILSKLEYQIEELEKITIIEGDEIEKITVKEPESNQSTNTFKRRLHDEKIKRDSSSKSVQSVTSESSNQELQNTFSLDPSFQVQIIMGMSKCVDLASELLYVKKNRKSILDLYDFITSSINKTIIKLFHDYQVQTNELLVKCMMVSKEILVVEKADVSILSTYDHYNDVEVQTIDPKEMIEKSKKDKRKGKRK